MLLPASSSFVTGVIKERARASTLPPRLSLFRPAALAGRPGGEMEGGRGEAPWLFRVTSFSLGPVFCTGTMGRTVGVGGFL